jgi:hypothetical protein
MAIATSTAIGIGAAISAGGAIAGSAISSHEQADATKTAAQIQEESNANTLAFQKQVYGTTLADEQPYMTAGNTAANALNAGISDGSLTEGWTTPFSFTGVDLQNDPAYQFDLSQGQQAVQRSAAAQGGLVSGGALKDLDSYSQGYASNQFQQSYENALGAYQQAYNIFSNNQANQFNRLSSVAGLGQNAVTQTATSGNAAAGTIANTNTNTANALSNLTTSQANASGAATIAATNQIGNAANSFANSLALQTGSGYKSPTAPVQDDTYWDINNAG